MSLKVVTKELFADFGLSDDEVDAYIVFLGFPQATASEVAGMMGKEYSLVQPIADSLVTKGFLRKIEGIIDRYIPLEPYLQLFNDRTGIFRKEINDTKDGVLADQTTRFESLEKIQDDSITEIDTAKTTQVEQFFKDSDSHDLDKKGVIDNARTRFTDTCGEVKTHVNDSEKKLESDIHTVVDALNQKLKEIAESFKTKYGGGINSQKDEVNKITDDLLGDFATRIDNLEKELKSDLDTHHQYEVDVANELKPSLDRILEKYLLRMKEVLDALKRDFTNLLQTHTKDLHHTNNNMKMDVINKVTERQNLLVQQVRSFKSKTVNLITNLIDLSDKIGQLGLFLSKRGSAFKSLFGGHKKWVVIYEDIKKRVGVVGEEIKADFGVNTEGYITDTESTKDALKSEVESIVQGTNATIEKSDNDLDAKQKEQLAAELNNLATDLSKDCYDKVDSTVEDTKKVITKLKDSLENSLHTHHKDYEIAINKHRDVELKHNDTCNTDVVDKVGRWYDDMDRSHEDAKRDGSKLIDGEIRYVHTQLDDEVKVFSDECAGMEQKLHAMLEDHKAKYNENSTNLQQSLTKTIEDNIQNTKDAIADFTLNFMNSIDDCTESAEELEVKLIDINDAAKNVDQLGSFSTWHEFGHEALIETIIDCMTRVKSTITIITPTVEPKILEALSQVAFSKKTARFLYTTNWDLGLYGPIIDKMKNLGNIQFKNLTKAFDFFAVSKDSEEIVLCPLTRNKDDQVSIHSVQDGYAQVFSSFIHPIFQANSRKL